LSAKGLFADFLNYSKVSVHGGVQLGLNFSKKTSEVHPVECVAYSTGADLTGACPACPVECGAYSSGVGMKYPAGVKS